MELHGYVFAPVATGIDLCDDSSDIPISGVPASRYVIDGTISINPAVNGSAATEFLFDGEQVRMEAIQYGNKLLPHMGVTVALESICEPSDLRSKRHEFITSSPTTMVMLGLRIRLFGGPDEGHLTSVAIRRESNGIRI